MADPRITIATATRQGTSENNADALVAAPREDADGYRDDVTVAVIQHTGGDQ